MYLNVLRMRTYSKCCATAKLRHPQIITLLIGYKEKSRPHVRCFRRQVAPLILSRRFLKLNHDQVTVSEYQP